MHRHRCFVLSGSALLAFSQVCLAEVPWSFNGGQIQANLGLSVANAGDVNGDGIDDLLVAAPYYDTPNLDAGRVYLFLGSVSGLPATPSWSADGPHALAQFGTSVSGAGDVNGDGYDDVIIGAPGYSNGQTNEGGAFVYLGGPTGLAATWAWKYEPNQASARAGVAVAGAGDTNNDGYADVIVGVSRYTNLAPAEGRATLFRGSASGVVASASWTVDSKQADAHYGSAVAAAGDVNGDGYADVLVGAPEFDAGQTDEGRAFLYTGGPTGLTPVAVWSAESNQTGARFGAALAGLGDVNGDGFDDVAIGAYLYDGGATDGGRVSVYQGSATGLPATTTWTVDLAQGGANLGVSVARAGDVNGDGYDDLVAGAFGFDNGQLNEGLVRVWTGSATGLGMTAFANDECDQTGAFLGYAVAGGDFDGDGAADVVGGAPYADAPNGDDGIVFVYRGHAPLAGDINGDGIVNGVDLGLLLGAWGSNDVGADLTHDGVVNGADIGVLLGGWTG
ncbi:MAG: FG-GAP-like repeat-containing protein [Phycisphaerales bacterium]